jgi:hypothetical protein
VAIFAGWLVPSKFTHPDDDTPVVEEIVIDEPTDVEA